MKEFEPVLAIFRKYSSQGNALPTEETTPLYDNLWSLVKDLKGFNVPEWRLYQYVIFTLNKVVTQNEEALALEIESHVGNDPKLIECAKNLHKICQSSSTCQAMLKEIQEQFLGSLLAETGKPFLVIKQKELLLLYKQTSAEERERSRAQLDVEKQRATQRCDTISKFCSQYRLIKA